jgi:hypothetical protein
MSHLPTELDIKTDLRRSIMASYTPKKFTDNNVKIFMRNARKNLESLKEKIGTKRYMEVKSRIAKAENPKNPIKKRREDLLTASVLIG